MSASKNLRAALLADGGIASVVGTSVYDRHIPKNKPRPFIFLRRIGSDNYGTLSGNHPPARVLIRVECVADSVADADNLSDLVREFLDGYPAGELGSGTVGGVLVEDITDEWIPRSVEADEGLTVSGLETVLITPRD